VKEILYDTWAYVAAADRRDQHHAKAVELAVQVEEVGLHPVTSTDIMNETLTLLRRRAGHRVAVEFGEGLRQSTREGTVTLVMITEAHLEKAWNLFKRYKDIPKLSFTDCTSFVIMQERGIKYVFTGDTHFEQVNLGFQIFKG
jgi:predicted nucleic acid-binding protein